MKKLSIPEQITLERVFLPGMGLRELKQWILLSLPGVIVMLVLLTVFSAPGPKLIGMICGFGWVAGCYAVTAKIEGVGSMYAYILRILRYHKTQQKFYYKQEKEVLEYVEKRR